MWRAWVTFDTVWHERSRVYREKKLPECGAAGHWAAGHGSPVTGNGEISYWETGHGPDARKTVNVTK